MKYLGGSFSVHMGGGKDWDERWEKTFGRKSDSGPVAAKDIKYAMGAIIDAAEVVAFGRVSNAQSGALEKIKFVASTIRDNTED